MDNLSEHNFDDLFREGSEKVEFEYREDAWAALDERLDEKERKRRLLWILAGLILSTMVIGAMFYYFNNSQSGASKIAPVQENVAITELQKEVPTTEEVKNAISPIAEENTNSSQIVDNATIKNTTAKAATQQTINTDFTKEISSSSSNIQTSEQANFTIPVLKEKQEEFILKNDSQKELKQNIQTTNPPLINTTPLSITKETAPIAALSLQEVENEEEEVSVDEFSKIVKPAKKPKSQFSFGAFASLDYNSLSLTDDKIEQGYRVGLRTDYNFARRFSVGIGAAFSRKTYTAQGFRYNAKPGFWSDGIAPIEVSAISNVIEIPLELRYYAKGHNQDGFFAGTGINSYHNSLEKYDFRYEEVLANTINNWEERGTNTNLFSVATFTFGYQKTLNSGLAFQIAPYVNLPLTGIGQGNVNLQSAGLNIAVNWRK